MTIVDIDRDEPAPVTDAATVVEAIVEGRSKASDDTSGGEPPVRPCGASDPLLLLVYHELDRSFAALGAALQQLGSSDGIESVHRARTATRQIRGTLKTYEKLLPRAAARELAPGIAALADALGRVRDLDVHRSTLERQLVALPPEAAADVAPYLHTLDVAHVDARLALDEHLGSQRHLGPMEAFGGFLAREPTPAALRRSLGFSARDGAAQIAVRGLRKLRKAGRRLGRHAPVPELHEFRIRCKRLRYRLQAFEPVFGNKLRPAIRGLARLQDVLGAHRDCIVAIERLRTHAATCGTAAAELRCRRRLEELVGLYTREAAENRSRFRHEWQRFERRVHMKRLRRRLAVET